MSFSRRSFLKHAAAATAAGAFPLHSALAGNPSKKNAELYKISLAQYSLHRAFRSGEKDPIDFARISREVFGIDAIEYVNQFYFDTLNDKVVNELAKRSKDEGVKNLLIMCDHEGALGDPDKKMRNAAVKNHYRWADTAHALGCHAIRVNAQSAGSYDEQMKFAADGLNQLAEYCAKLDLSVIVENHGGFSSNGAWLSGVMKLADNPRVGTLPDFGNFTINRETGESYDKYKGVEELMPFAKAVSAKAFRFNEKGEEPDIDFYRMMKLVVDAGYSGYVGIEYEGKDDDEIKGIKQTQALLEKVREALV